MRSLFHSLWSINHSLHRKRDLILTQKRPTALTISIYGASNLWILTNSSHFLIVNELLAPPNTHSFTVSQGQHSDDAAPQKILHPNLTP